MTPLHQIKMLSEEQLLDICRKQSNSRAADLHRELFIRIAVAVQDELIGDKDVQLVDTPVSWKNEFGGTVTISNEKASKLLGAFYNEWPGGLEEVDASINTWRSIAEDLAMHIRRISASVHRNCDDDSNVLKLTNAAMHYLYGTNLTLKPFRDGGIDSDNKITGSSVAQ